jgi:hypothetical protein
MRPEPGITAVKLTPRYTSVAGLTQCARRRNQVLSNASLVSHHLETTELCEANSFSSSQCVSKYFFVPGSVFRSFGPRAAVQGRYDVNLFFGVLPRSLQGIRSVPRYLDKKNPYIRIII